MKRYLIFAFYGYYPNGGWDDFQGSHVTLKKARESLAILESFDHYQIVDTKINKILDAGRMPKHENK